MYTRCKRVFSVLPLAALVQQNTLVLHGGLFRQQPRTVKVAKNKRKRGNPVLLGALGARFQLGGVAGLYWESARGAWRSCIGRRSSAVTGTLQSLYDKPLANPPREKNPVWA